MLQGIRIYTDDTVWRKVLENFGAVAAANASVADIDFDSLNIAIPVSPLELKSVILNAIDKRQRDVVRSVFGRSVDLPRLQMQIVVLLYQTGGMFINDLKTVLGISPDIATHTIDAAIYRLRKTYGRDFIKNENGRYSLSQFI
jgi:hypothetical protein